MASYSFLEDNKVVLLANKGEFIIDDTFFHDETVVLSNKVLLDMVFLLGNF